MSAKGYTNATLVAQELGRDLTAPQLDQCADVVIEAEAWIDHETGRAWLVATPIADELHTLDGSQLVYLNSRPVAAITSVKVRAIAVGAADTTLVANTDYELVDPLGGVLLVTGFLGVGGGDVVTTALRGSLLKVTYSALDATPPGDIRRAATLLVAHWLQPRLEPDRQGVDSYSVGGDLSVKVRAADDIPAEVLRLVRGHERVVFA